MESQREIKTSEPEKEAMERTNGIRESVQGNAVEELVQALNAAGMTILGPSSKAQTAKVDLAQELLRPEGEPSVLEIDHQTLRTKS